MFKYFIIILFFKMVTCLNIEMVCQNQSCLIKNEFMIEKIDYTCNNLSNTTFFCSNNLTQFICNKVYYNKYKCDSFTCYKYNINNDYTFYKCYDNSNVFWIILFSFIISLMNIMPIYLIFIFAFIFLSNC
jgi:uncharacterized membrane protein YciS (DUF1049 family)